jgi:hypothetical protein
MALYVTLSEGPRADLTQPILVLSERRIINVLLQEIGQLGHRQERIGLNGKAVQGDKQMPTKNDQTQDPRKS